MSENVVRFSDLASANLLEIGAGRPRSAGLDQSPLSILRVADIAEGRALPSSQTNAPLTDSQARNPKISKPGDVVLTTKGTVGRVAIMPSDGPSFAYSPQLCYFRPIANGPLKARYLYYWFHSAEFWEQADALKGQTDMADFISLSDIYSLAMRLPSVAEQQAVIGILGALDDKIAANERVCRLADDLSRSLWTRSASVGSPVPLTALASFVNGKAFTKGASGEGKVVIRISELNSGLGPSTVYSDIDVAEEYLARPGDLLFAWSGSLTVSRWFRSEAIINQHIFKVIPRDGYPVWLVNQALRAKLQDFRAIASDKATTMGHIQRHHLDDVTHVPSADEVCRIANVMDGLWHSALAAEQENVKLAATRDELLPLLMSGKVSVKDAEAVASDVL